MHPPSAPLSTFYSFVQLPHLRSSHLHDLSLFLRHLSIHLVREAIGDFVHLLLCALHLQSEGGGQVRGGKRGTSAQIEGGGICGGKGAPGVKR